VILETNPAVHEIERVKDLLLGALLSERRDGWRRIRFDLSLELLFWDVGYPERSILLPFRKSRFLCGLLPG
jgi:hypothetical protein